MITYGRRDDDIYTEKRRKRSIIISENDRIASSIVKYRDGYVCQMCKKAVVGRNADWSHIIPRTHWSVRWLTSNAFCACFRCHKFVWHGDPTVAAEWAKEFFGEKYLARLREQDVLIKVNDEWVNGWNKYLKDEYLRMTGFVWKV